MVSAAQRSAAQHLELARHKETTTTTSTILFSGRTGGGWQTLNMWKPNWACTTCGMLSSRRYSVKRHIMKLHSGNGLEVRYVDYMAGMLTGIYKPNLSKQKSSPKYNTYPNNFYNPNTRPNTSSSLFSSDANPFMQYGRSEGVYPSGSDSIFYFDQSYKAMKPSSLVPPSQVYLQSTHNHHHHPLDIRSITFI
jgi:hypothetical protein